MIEKGIIVLLAWKRIGNTDRRIETFLRKIIFALNAAKRKFLLGKEFAQNVEPRIVYGENQLLANRKRDTIIISVNSKKICTIIALVQEYVPAAEKEKQFLGKRSVLYAWKKMQNFIDRRNFNNLFFGGKIL